MEKPILGRSNRNSFSCHPDEQLLLGRLPDSVGWDMEQDPSSLGGDSCGFCSEQGAAADLVLPRHEIGMCNAVDQRAGKADQATKQYEQWTQDPKKYRIESKYCGPRSPYTRQLQCFRVLADTGWF